MKFTTSILAMAMASVITAQSSVVDSNPTDGVTAVDNDQGRVDWISQDDVDRIVHCTPSSGHVEIADTKLPAGQTVTAYHPEGWIGMCYAVIEGEENKGYGMLAEFCWNGWGEKTYFDVSAIDDQTDVDNIKMMMPAKGDTPTSGCQDIAVGSCDKMYINPDDVQTRVTDENHLLVLVGNLPSTTASRRSKRGGPVKRSYILHGHE